VLGAVVLVLLAEAGIRALPLDTVLRYGEGLGTYYEVRHTIEQRGAAEIALLGSSRGRETVVVPDLQARVAAALGRTPSVANYSCPDAKTSDMLHVVDLLGSSAQPSRLVLYFVSPRTLHGEGENIQRQDVFGIFPDQYGRSTAHWLASLSERPFWDLRNALIRDYATFRHRYFIRNLLANTPRGRRPVSPVQGEETTWQRYNATRSLVSHPVSEAQIRSYVARLLDDDGRYVMGDERIRDLEAVVASCRRAGMELILVGTPLSAELALHYPRGVIEDYYRAVDDLSRRLDVEFLTTDLLGLRFGRDDFREQSHLNRQGAERMTAALVDQVILPRLQDGTAD